MPRVVDHAARRTEIVYALWAVIHEKGLDGVSFRAVAEEAGISIGRIQHYFTSKQELIRAGCTQMVEVAGTQYAAHSQGAGPEQSLWELVSSPIPSTQPQRLGTAVWYAYLAKSASDPALRAIIADAVDVARLEARRLLQRADGADAAADEAGIDRTALGLLALGDGLAQRVVVGAMHGPEALEVLAEEFSRHGLAPVGDIAR